ncbi:hypothetical protein BY458DRAFT_529994 [Sporodiniella umbellata]|nr:hypothetical protein BY458DRAFT_529994 [Sporodiniella umbellata]
MQIQSRVSLSLHLGSTQESDRFEALLLLSRKQLREGCSHMNTELLTRQLVQNYTRLKDAQDPKKAEDISLPFQGELTSHLESLEDPSTFIICCLENLANLERRPIHLRNLVSIFSGSLSSFIYTLTFKQEDSEKGMDSIPPSIYRVTTEERKNSLLSDPKSSQKIKDRIVSSKHHNKLIGMIRTVKWPEVIVYTMDVFGLTTIIGFKGENVENGVELIQRLVKGGFTTQATNAIVKLQLLSQFPINELAFQVFAVDQKANLNQMVSGHPHLQQELLNFIDTQLCFVFVDLLKIVPHEQARAMKTSNIKQLPWLRDKKFRKLLTSSGVKLAKVMNAEADQCRFIVLYQSYASLCYFISKREDQQKNEQDWSIEQSSNYNGLIDRICEKEPVLAKVVVKMLIDLCDIQGSLYFAERYNETEYMHHYWASIHQDTPIESIVDMPRPTHQFKKSVVGEEIRFYKLPVSVIDVFVNSRDKLLYMKQHLLQSRIACIDTEWAPEFTSFGSPTTTALIQIATDMGHVFLLDIQKLGSSHDIEITKTVESMLRSMFESEDILKIVYGFSEDFKTLHQTLQYSKKWKIKSILDFNTLTSPPTETSVNGEPIRGGLSAVVKTYLHCTLNKKQQLSNWSQRPLSEDQLNYAACDAVCMLEIYEELWKLNHPFIQKYSKFIYPKRG